MPQSIDAPTPPELPTAGLVAVVKEDCPTCRLVEPVLEELARRVGSELLIISQDTVDFAQPPEDSGARQIHDRDLALSDALAVEIVPTLFRRERGRTVESSVGWHREQWTAVSGINGLGADLPDTRPGCGALNQEESHQERLALRRHRFVSRHIDLGDEEDPVEACFARGWTDGLPVVPPTAERVLRMLSGTTRDPAEVLGEVAPDLVECTVEKVAVNAAMAGCLPEYLPVVLAAVEAALTPEFNWHGLAATTYFSGPVIIVNGPIVDRLGLNSGINALGQGHRANATIGRALNLTLRNVGGARPGEIDRATLGNPGKLSFCIAEREPDSPWPSLASSRGIAGDESAVTLFAGEGPRGVVDQLSRNPSSLCRSLAWALRSVAHPKLILGFDAVLVISPEHGRVFREAQWDRGRVLSELQELLLLPAEELTRGAGECAEGLPEAVTAQAERLPKFKPDGLLLMHAGGDAGLFSAVIGGWVNGEMGSQPVTRRIR